MGQYYLTVNTSKKQFIKPHNFNDGLKLMEFGASGSGTMMALAVLLADGNGRGGGDLHSKNPVIGSWAGDKIVVAGDYADPGKFMPKTSIKTLQKIADKVYTEGNKNPENVNLYTLAQETFEDISVQVMAALLEDSYIAEQYAKIAENEYVFGPFQETYKAAMLLRKLVA